MTASYNYAIINFYRKYSKPVDLFKFVMSMVGGINIMIACKLLAIFLSIEYQTLPKVRKTLPAYLFLVS